MELQNCNEEERGGTYVMDLLVEDLAKHSAEDKYAFVIDTTAPTVTITFDNNDVLNKKYYNDERTATITVKERNFNNESGTATGKATLDGKEIDFPKLGSWTDSKDFLTHTAKVAFTADGLYEDFTATYTDLAGLVGSSTADDFVIDTVLPEITISGVEDKSANNGELAPSITYTDINLDLDSVEIVLTGTNNGVVEYPAAITQIHNGETYIYADFAYEKLVDDIYTLYVHAVDLAGNEMTQTIQFSCNRFGSVFDLSEIADMLNKYNQEERTIEVIEVNVDPIDPESVRITLTKNGTPIDLVLGEDFTVELIRDEALWYRYHYEIFSDLFADDGTYSLYFYTEDMAGNINENIDDSKEAQIAFGIDKTKPIVSPADLENDGRYNQDGKTVYVEIKDNLLLEDVKIYLNGEEVNYIVDGETYIFDIPKSGDLQDVRIVAVDAAGNEQDIQISGVLVTTSIWARWYHNTPLFIGSMVLLAALLGFGIWRFFIIFFKKKDEDEEEEA